MSGHDLLQMYANRMGEMKQRMIRIEGILERCPGLGGMKTAQEDGAAAEDFALQFRKVLELIAFSGLIANKEIYESAFSDFKSHAYPSKIAKRLQALHPRWFPEHVKLIVVAAGSVGGVQPVASAFTRELWQTLYDKMGVILHIGNPFAGPVRIELTKSIPDTYQIVKRHMQTHHARVLHGAQFVCDLGHWPDGHCSIHEAFLLEEN